MQIVWHVLVPVLLYDLLLTAMTVMPFENRISAVLAAAVPGILFFGIWFREEQRACGNDKPKQKLVFRSSAHILLLGIASCVLFNNLIELLQFREIFPQVQEVSEAVYAPSFFMQILGVGIVIPIAEELVFRGMVYRRLRESCAVMKALLISSLIFAVFHGNVVQGIYAFILGFLMAWVYERYQTLKASITFHIAANLSAVLLTGLVGHYEVKSTDKSFIMMTLLAAVLVFWSAKMIIQEDNKEVRF